MKKIYLILVCILFLSSCSNMHYKKNKGGINISSNPSKAYIYVDGWITKTPASIPIFGKKHIIKFKKDGYKDKEIEVNGDFNFFRTYIGNMIFLIFYPVAIWHDINTGAAWEINENINVNLKKND
ncbi:PEGA domain-containing protein [Flavobacteriaceae bacterium]|nr:PEGA domain-containing protein [Flavobacteriaceae bacterium]